MEGYHAGDNNLYRYVSNNPTNATDPRGLEPETGRYGANAHNVYNARVYDIKLVTDATAVLPLPIKDFAFGQYDINRIGPIFNDGRQYAANYHWVLISGANLDDLEVKRYVSRTGSFENFQDTEGILTKGEGYKGPGVKISKQQGADDGPSSASVKLKTMEWIPPRAGFLVVADIPGFKAWRREYGAAEYKANFYVEARSRIRNRIEAQIWYDVVVRLDRSGKVIENTVKYTDSTTTAPVGERINPR